MTSPSDGSADDPAQPDPDTPTSLEHRELRIRRAPKVPVFLVGGALLGVIVAFLVSLTGTANPEFTFGTTFGYFAVIFGVLGVGAGGLVWLALDRRSRKRAYTVRAQSVEDVEDADYAVDPHDLQQWRDKWENGGRDENAR